MQLVIRALMSRTFSLIRLPYSFIVFIITVTILGAVVMVLLFLSEFHTYLSPNISEELFVDTSRGHKLRINLDIIVPSISCNCKYILMTLTTALLVSKVID